MGAAPFAFPPHYTFPPFFTLQPNLTTRASQLQSWSSLIQTYCRHSSLFTLSLIDAVQTPLFKNERLNKRLSLRDAKAVLDWMSSDDGGKRAEPLGESGRGKGAPAGGEGGTYWIYWRRPEEWAEAVEAWVDETGQKGSVLTLFELVESDATTGQEFHGMPMDLLQKSLQLLAKRGKAQIFAGTGGEDSMGVKFF